MGPWLNEGHKVFLVAFACASIYSPDARHRLIESPPRSSDPGGDQASTGV